MNYIEFTRPEYLLLLILALKVKLSCVRIVTKLSHKICRLKYWMIVSKYVLTCLMAE